MRPRLSSLLPCAGLAPAAGALGAALDERTHSGLTTWISLCRGGGTPYLRSLVLQLQLLPYALCAMLTATLIATALLGLRRGTPASARMVLAGHSGCLVATLAAPLLCPLLLGPSPTPHRALGGMAIVEVAITLAVAGALLGALGERRRLPSA